MGFGTAQVREFVRRAKAEAGPGWAMLGTRLQRALLAERALFVLAGQAAPSVPTEAIGELLDAMLSEAGIEKDG